MKHQNFATAKPIQLASNIKKLQNLIASDSDSYGSEGHVNKKTKKVRGVKKRKKGDEFDSDVDSDSVYESKMGLSEDEEAIEIWSKPKTREQIEREKREADELEAEIRKQRNYERKQHAKEVKAKKMEEKQTVDEINKQIKQVTQSIDLKPKKYDDVPEDSDCATPIANTKQNQNLKESTSILIKAGAKQAAPYVHVKQRTLSPPLIKEYDPNEDNAKIRAAKRREELQKREQITEVDKTQYPEDPTPWKGKPSDFFILHAPRKGTHKVLNNSQKEFILVYYPDTVVDQVSLMEFLYRQAKQHEDRQNALEQEKSGMIMIGKKKKGMKSKMANVASYIKEIKHINEEQKYIRRDTSKKPVNFAQILDGKDNTPQYQESTGGLADILGDFSTSNKFYDAALADEPQSHVLDESGTVTHQSQMNGIEALKAQHAISNRESSLHAQRIQAMNRQVEEQRKKVLINIIEAKRRQARMEAEEARRLKDEAVRLMQQAKILELEAQRPLLEAQRLDAEIRLLEQQYGKVPGTHLSSQVAQPPQQVQTGLDKIYGGSTATTSFGLDDVNIHQARQAVNQRKEQIIDDVRSTRFQIAQLQNQTMQMNQGYMQPPAFQNPRQSSVGNMPLQRGRSPFGGEVITERGTSLIISENSIAARQAIANANAQAMKEKAKRERIEREMLIKEKQRQEQEALEHKRKMQEERLRLEQEKRRQEIKQQEERTRLEEERRKIKEREKKRDQKRKKKDTSSEDDYDSESGEEDDSNSSRRSEESQTEQDTRRDEKSDEEESQNQSENESDEEDKPPPKRKQQNNEYDDEQQSINDSSHKGIPKGYKYAPKIKQKPKSPPPEKKVEKKKKKPSTPSSSEVSPSEASQNWSRPKQKKRSPSERSDTPPKKKEKKPVPKIAKRAGPSEILPELDPYLDAADAEYNKALKAFNKAQGVRQEAIAKKEKLVKKQQDELTKASEDAKKFFAQQKQKTEEHQKRFGGKNVRQAQDEAYDEETEELLSWFNKIIDENKKEQKQIKNRYIGRNNCVEFLTPILNGHIMKEFDESKGYINFKPYLLPDNFYEGHEEYFRKWRHLFLYETYSFLMNSRWSKFTGSDLDLKNQLLKQQKEKAMCWKGYFQFKATEGKFTTLKMLKDPPSIGQFVYNKGKNWSKIYDEPDRTEGAKFQLSHCREEDLIVISKFRINLEGQDDIKMVSGGSKFLREVLNKQGVILGLITKCESKIHRYVEVVIDNKYSQQFTNALTEEEKNNVFTRYVYFFDSVLTCQREFRALKHLEFTRMCPILCYPSLTMDHKEKILDDYCEVYDSSFEDLDGGPEMYPMAFEGDGTKAQNQMNNYLIHNHQKFNKSQARVLEQVIEMPKDDILLIQGPPGTGKTHTIIGIISMLMSSTLANSKQKIMVCAPSNAAIDQIISRIIEKGLIGMVGLKRPVKKNMFEEAKNSSDDDSSDEDNYEAPDLFQTLVRITSAEYTTETDIKKYTLEQRIIKKLCIEKFGELKRCIKLLKELITEMNDFDSWDLYQDFPYVNKVKFKNYTKTVKEAYLKKVDCWGDINLTRQQQLNAMKQQLLIHEKELGDFKTGQNVEQGNMEWKEAESFIISEAKIICCTLSMAGSQKMEPFVGQFEYLIIDEACQSTEPSTLIPFGLAPKRVILVGDQKQLPATTFSGNSEKTGYCRSLFERLLDSGFDKTMLTIQFRMHPKIRAFPSEQFYAGAITDHASVGTRHSPASISNLARIFPERMIFFDIMDSEEAYDNKSKCNYAEADFTTQLVDFMARKMSLQGTLKYIAGQIGLISPYKAQVRQLASRIEKLCSDQSCNMHETIEVNTVDAFQGSEKNIIIFNCVRSNYETIIEKSLGFLLDERRLNVALTRPKYFLMIVGNSRTLQKSIIWEDMVDYCRAAGSYVKIKDSSQFERMSDFKKHVVSQFVV